MRDCTDLVVKAHAGDREALGRLLAAVQDDVYHLLLSRLRDAADAEDAAQETLVQAITSLPDLREPRAFAGWLFRIALDKARRAKRSPSLETASEPIAKAEADPMEREETKQAVRRAVAGLEENLRTTVAMRYEHGLAYADIARAMDCPEGTVADRLHTAHERLKRALAGAGFAITMALLETELSAAPRTPAPPRLAARVAKTVREAPLVGPGPGPTGPRSRTKVAGVVAALVLAVFVAWKLYGPATDESSQSSASSGASDAPGDKVADASTGPPANGTPTPRSGTVTPASTGRFIGRVYERDSKTPIAGAEIVLSPSRADPGKTETRESVSARSDKDGRFSLDAEPGIWNVEARAPGFVWFAAELQITTFTQSPGDNTEEYLTSSRVTLTAGLESSRVIDLVSGVRTRGRVVDDLGLAVAGAHVTFGLGALANGRTMTLTDGSFHGLSPVLSDREGRFEFADLWPAGDVNYTARCPGYREGAASIKLSAVPPEATIVLKRIPGIRVWGTVRDLESNALKGARVYAGNDAFLQALDGATDELGRFDYSSVSSGRLAIAWAPGRGPAVLALDAIPPGGLNAKLPVMEGRIAGHVVDGYGQPLAGVTVTVLGIGARSESGTGWLLYEYASVYSRAKDAVFAFLPPELEAPVATSGDDGGFSFEGFCVGSGSGVKLLAIREGYLRCENDFFEPGEMGISMRQR
ncbi:MAG: sigma-70 family RNA polymerase sigma factor [Planctomycetota bacterium]